MIWIYYFRKVEEWHLTSLNIKVVSGIEPEPNNSTTTISKFLAVSCLILFIKSAELKSRKPIIKWCGAERAEIACLDIDYSFFH